VFVLICDTGQLRSVLPNATQNLVSKSNKESDGSLQRPWLAKHTVQNPLRMRKVPKCKYQEGQANQSSSLPNIPPGEFGVLADHDVHTKEVLGQQPNEHQSVNILHLALRCHSTILVLTKHGTAVEPGLCLSNHADGSCTIDGGEETLHHPVTMLLQPAMSLPLGKANSNGKVYHYVKNAEEENDLWDCCVTNNICIDAVDSSAHVSRKGKGGKVSKVLVELGILGRVAHLNIGSN